MDTKNSGKTESDQPKKIHRPEFIVIDSMGEKIDPNKEGNWNDLLTTLNDFSKQSFSLKIRLMAFLLAVSFVFVMAFVVCLGLIEMILAGMCLFKNANLNALLRKIWQKIKKLSVVTAGLWISIFSPQLGFSVILLYFMQHGESLKHTFFEGVFKTSTPPNKS